MTANINEAIQKIKQVGASNARIVPEPGQSAVDGNHRIEVREVTGWVPVVTGIKRKMAEDIVAQAVNRVILG
jgi:hypothetical protein